MDFHTLKRRELQVLCKKHKIPANLTNAEMAEKLAALFADNEKPLTRGRQPCLKRLDENVIENESDVEIKPAKQLRFSPENEMIEFEKSQVKCLEIRGRARRKSVRFVDKGGSVTVSSSDCKVNDEISAVRRSRRGKFPEGSELETKGRKRETNGDALVDTGNADDTVNAEVREVRRSRRGKFLEESEFESKGRERATNGDALVHKGNADDTVNAEVKEVRRSRRGKFPEGSEFETKGRERATNGDALVDKGNADDTVNAEVREVRGSRRGKFPKGNEFETKGRERAMNGDALVDKINADDTANAEVREARRSRRGKFPERSEFETNGRKRPTNGDALVDKGYAEVRVVRRSRRGKLPEGRVVESRGGKRVTKVDALEDNVPVDNAMNGDVREVRRSRRGTLPDGGEVECKGGKRATKIDALKGNGPVENAMNGYISEVRRSRRGKLPEGGEVECKEVKRATKVDAADDNVINYDLVDGGVRSVRRSRRGKLIEGTDVSKGSLPSTTDNVLSENLRNEEHVVGKKRSLRNWPVVDEKGGNDDMEKGSRKNTNVRNLRSRKAIDNEDVTGSEETLVESVAGQPEPVVRRSNRHVAKVDSGKIVNLNMSRGRLESTVDLEVNKISKVDNVSQMVVVKEGSLVEGNLRRSKRSASKPECSVSMQGVDEIMNLNDKMDTKKQRTCAVLEEVKIGDANPNERSLRRSTRNTERSGSVLPPVERGKVANKEKGRSNRTKTKVKDSSAQDVSTTTADQDARAFVSEVAEDTFMDNLDNAVKELASVPDFGNNDPAESNFLREGVEFGTASATFVDNVQSPLTDKQTQKQAVVLALGNDLKPALFIRTPLTAKNDCLEKLNDCVQSSLGDVIGKLDNQHGANTESISSEAYVASPCRITNNKEMLESCFGEENEQRNFEEHNSSELENRQSLIGVREETVNESPSDAIQTALNDACESKQDDLNRKMHPTKIIMQQESTLVQMNGCGPNFLPAAQKIFDQPQLSSLGNPKSDEDDNSMTDCYNVDEILKSKASDGFNESGSRNLQDDDLDSSEDLSYPSDSQGKILVPTSPLAKPVEASTEFSPSVFSDKMELHESDFTVEWQGKPFKAVDLESHPKLSTLSPSMQKDVEADLVEDGGHLAESSGNEGVEQSKPPHDGLDLSSQYHAERTRFSIICNQDGPDRGDSVGISVVQGEITKLPSGDAQIVEVEKGSEDCAEGEMEESSMQASCKMKTPSTSEDAGLLDRCSTPVCRSMNVVADILDQLDLTTEGMDEGLYSCEVGIDMEMHGRYVGSEDDFMNLENKNSNKLESVMHEGKMEESASVQVSCMAKTPSTIEDAGLDKCSTRVDKSMNVAADIVEDQLELTTEDMEKGLYSCEVRIDMEMLGTYVGSEGAFMNLENENSNELESHQRLNTVSEGALNYLVDSEKHLELRAQSSEQKNVVSGDFSLEAHTKEGRNIMESDKSKEFGEVKNQENSLNDCLVHGKVDSPAGKLVQDVVPSDTEHSVEMSELGGMISFSPNVVNQIIEERSTEIEFSAKKTSSMRSYPPSSNSLFIFQSSGTNGESTHSLLIADNAQSRGHEACFQGETKDESDFVHALSVVQTPSSSKDGDLGRLNMLMYGKPYGVNHGVNDEIISLSEGVALQRKCDSDCKTDIEREVLQSDFGEDSPTNFDFFKILEAEAIYSTLEGETSGVSQFDQVCVPNSLVEGNTSNHENDMERVIKERNDGFCQPDEISTREEQEKEVSSDEILDAEKDETRSTTEPNLFTNALEGINKDGLKTLFGISGQDNNNVQHEEQMIDDLKFQRSIDVVEGTTRDDEHAESGAEILELSCSKTKIPSSESRDAGFPFYHTENAEKGTGNPVSISFGAQGTFPQIDAKEIVTELLCQDHDASECFISKHQTVFKETEVSSIEDSVDALEDETPSTAQQNTFINAFGETNETTKDDEHAESGHEVKLSTSEIKIPPTESNGDDSFPFDHTEDAKEGTETSVAGLFQVQVTVPQIDTKEVVMNPQIPDTAASEFSVSEHHLVFEDFEVLDSMVVDGYLVPLEDLSLSTENTCNTLQSSLLTDVLEQVSLIQPEAAKVEVPVGAAGKSSSPLAKELDRGKATDLVEIVTKPVSGAVDGRFCANADRASECNVVSKFKANFQRRKNLDAAADESISSAVKHTVKRKNARTILIHGTPKKPQMASHLREDEPNSKLGKAGSLTAVRTAAKRTSLKHLPWRI